MPLDILRKKIMMYAGRVLSNNENRFRQEIISYTPLANSYIQNRPLPTIRLIQTELLRCGLNYCDIDNYEISDLGTVDV